MLRRAPPDAPITVPGLCAHGRPWGAPFDILERKGRRELARVVYVRGRRGASTAVRVMARQKVIGLYYNDDIILDDEDDGDDDEKIFESKWCVEWTYRVTLRRGSLVRQFQQSYGSHYAAEDFSFKRVAALPVGPSADDVGARAAMDGYAAILFAKASSCLQQLRPRLPDAALAHIVARALATWPAHDLDGACALLSFDDAMGLDFLSARVVLALLTADC